MRTFYLLVALLFCKLSFSQDLKKKMDDALNKLALDEQFKHSILSMYLVDGKTGKVLYDKNGEVGLVPASCQKVVTSVSAFELLGKSFRYKTTILKDYSVVDSINHPPGPGCLFIQGSGDPTLGSWRWKSTTDTVIFLKIAETLKRQHLTLFTENLVIEDYDLFPVPAGWVWEDIGNYYGAGCFGFNWHENQFDMELQPADKLWYPATINSIEPFPFNTDIYNSINTGEKGSGDNAYIFSAPFSNTIITKGSVQLQKEPFIIKGSMPNPANFFKNDLMNYLSKKGIQITGSSYSAIESEIRNITVHKGMLLVDSIFSPPLDSMNYWFLKKSINLYGEAFVKTISKQKTGAAITDSGVNIIRNFWVDKGIEKSSLKIIDGSGLSPANRLTTNALVTVLQYAKQRPWFSSFYNALPEMNGIKMKDGYIGGVRSYTGYVKSASGVEYSFAFIVNNFDGNPATVREKMWKVLDLLK